MNDFELELEFLSIIDGILMNDNVDDVDLMFVL